MAKIYQLKNKDWKSKTWYASFKGASGKRVQKCLGVTNKKDAQEMLDGIVGDIAHGKFNLPVKSKRVLIQDYVRYFLEVYCSNNHADRTLGIEEGFFNKHFLPFCKQEGVTILSEINLQLMEKYKAWLKKKSWLTEEEKCHQKKKEAEHSSINRELTVIKKMISLAEAEGKIQQNPFIQGRKNMLKNLPVEEKEPRYLTLDEIRRLVEAAESAPRWKKILMFLICTGLRKGELQFLRWKDVNLDRRLITITSHSGHITKNRRVRYVPLNDTAMRILLDLRQESGESEYVFGVNEGSRPFVNNFDRSFRKIVQRAGLNDVHPHTLRHTFGSHHAMKGTSLISIKKMLGHLSPRMTEHYAHLSQDSLLEAAQKFELAEA